MIAGLIAWISTILGSVAHGGNWLPKGVILVLHAAIVATGLWLGGITGYWLALSIPIICLYWFTFRMGRQAKAELDDLADIGKPIKTWQAYVLPCAITASIAAGLFIYAGMWLWTPLVIVPFAFLWVPPLACKVWAFGGAVWPDTEENRKVQRKQRMKVEIAVTLAPAGMAIAILTYAIACAIPNLLKWAGQ